MFLSGRSNLVYCCWAFWLVVMVVLIFFQNRKPLQIFQKKMWQCHCSLWVQTHILLVLCLLRQGFKQSFASLLTSLHMSQRNERVGRSPLTRIATESLLMLTQRYREKVSVFRLLGSLELPDIANFSTAFVNNDAGVGIWEATEERAGFPGSCLVSCPSMDKKAISRK